MVQDHETTVRLSIERMAYGADAIAHDDAGKTVFVRGAVPGDVVEAHVDQESPTFSRAHVVEVAEPSPQRVEPACPYAGVCGGCPWAQISHEAQLEAKRANVVDSLVRIGHMDPMTASELVDECVAPSAPWGYRNKVELAFVARNGRAQLGMHDAAGTGVVRVDKCALLGGTASTLTKSVSGALGYLASSRHLSFERVGIRSSSRTHQVEIALWDEPGAFPRAQAARVLADATKATSVVRVLSKGPSKARRVTGVEVLGGHGFWEETVAEERMRLSAPSFFQVNTAGAEKLVELVLDGLEPGPEDVAMDLYCGAGTFTLPLARRCDFVSAVESYGPAVRDLRRNLEMARLDNVDAAGGDASREFPEEEASIIVVDPPRAGLAADVVEKLSAQPARAIAYVSCDPATLARDLARFAEAGTFHPVRVTPVDLFPQTFHVETVVLLSR